MTQPRSRPFHDPEKAREAQRKSVEARRAKKAAAAVQIDQERQRVLDEARRQLAAGVSFNDAFSHIGRESFPEVAASIFEKAKVGDGPAQRLVTEQLMGKATQRIEATTRRLIIVHPLITSEMAVEVDHQGHAHRIELPEGDVRELDS